MNADELAQMLDGEGEEVAFDFSSQRPPNEVHQTSQGHTMGEIGRSDSFDLQFEEADFAPTQGLDSSRVSSFSSPHSHNLMYLFPPQIFQPLFKD
jgi:cell cycle checkpoint control protein RAD9A